MPKPTSNSVLIDRDPFSGIETWFDYDEDNDTTIISTTGDVAPVLDMNEVVRNDPSAPWRKADMHHVASIPLVIIEKWLREDGIDVFNKDHWPAVQRKLNSSDWLKLRTSTTRV